MRMLKTAQALGPDRAGGRAGACLPEDVLVEAAVEGARHGLVQTIGRRLQLRAPPAPRRPAPSKRGITPPVRYFYIVIPKNLV